jgi:hypothetical protein
MHKLHGYSQRLSCQSLLFVPSKTHLERWVNKPRKELIQRMPVLQRISYLSSVNAPSGADEREGRAGNV